MTESTINALVSPEGSLEILSNFEVNRLNPIKFNFSIIVHPSEWFTFIKDVLGRDG